MRLYLSSFGFDNCAGELVALARGSKRVAVIVNALENRPEARARWLQTQTEELAKFGFIATELDLRKFFGKARDLQKTTDGVGAVWINGGNAIILRRAMKQSGFDEWIKSALHRDEVVYAGFSAAAVIVSAKLSGLELVDNATEAPDGYDRAIVWEGLGLLPYMIALHFRSDHPESSDVTWTRRSRFSNKMASRIGRCETAKRSSLMGDRNQCAACEQRV